MKIGGQAVRGVESSLIQQLRVKNNVSRAELARQMEIAPSTISQYVDRLIVEGFVQEGEKAVLKSGRWPTVLELNPRAGRFVGIDFEARQILATAVDFAQRPVAESRTSISASDTAETIIGKIEAAIDAVSRGDGPLLGVGIGVPGVVDTERGIALHYRFLRGWRDIPLVKLLSERFDAPIALENNIRAMALAEQLFGQGRGVDHFVCIGIRSGIGAGVILDGELYCGPKNLAGEIGSWPLEHGKTLEDLASLSAITELLVEGIRGGEKSSLAVKRGRVQVDDLIEAALKGDELTCDAIWEAGQVLGKVVAQLNMLLNPQRVILAGPLGQLKDAFVQSVRETVESYCRPPHATMPEIVGSQLGPFGGALGGASLAARRWEPAF